MRGVVSLASALSIPLLLNDGKEFPQRSLILFITFTVILVTLVFQGLTLPWIIRKINIKDIPDYPPAEEQEAGIQIRLMKVTLNRINERYTDLAKNNELAGFLKKQLESDVVLMQQRLESLECDTSVNEEVEAYNKMMLDLYTVQREELFRMRKEKIFSDEEIRRQQDQIDFDEAKILGSK